MPNVAVVIPARNEEKFIGDVLSHLLLQDLKPTRIIVVNDGSIDKTKEVASGFPGVEVVDLPPRERTALATPALAHVINHGLKKLEEVKKGNDPSTVNCDYIVKLDADHILPKNYISTIVNEMEKDKTLAICSGQIEGEGARRRPIGSSRVVRARFWSEVGLQYPTNYGFETFLVIKALQRGLKVKVMNDLMTRTLRKTGTDYSKNTFISRGKAYKALGYTRTYAVAAIAIIGMRNQRAAFYMLKGYNSKDVTLYDDNFRQFFRQTLRRTSLSGLVRHTAAVIFRHQL